MDTQRRPPRNLLFPEHHLLQLVGYSNPHYSAIIDRIYNNIVNSKLLQLMSMMIEKGVYSGAEETSILYCICKVVSYLPIQRDARNPVLLLLD